MKKISLIAFLPVILLCIISCKVEERIVERHDSISDYLKVLDEDSLTIDVGIITAANRKGIYYDKTLDEDLIYVYNDLVDHRLIFVNRQNEIRYEVDVTEYRKQGFETENVDVVSLDTIVILTRHTNQVYFLNRQGEIWKHLDLNEVLPFSHDIYEYGACVFAPVMFRDGSLLLTTYWADNDTVHINQNMQGWEKDHSYHKWQSCYLMRIDDVFTNSLKAFIGFYYYKRFLPQDSLSRIVPFSQYDFVENNMFITSMYSDLVMKLDVNNFNVLDTFKVTSEYTSIGMDCISLDNPDPQSGTLLNSRNAGLITSLRYDKYRENFYVTMYAENPKPYKLDVKKRNWVLQKYDKDFNLLAEYYCDDESFMPYLLFTKDAVLIQKNIYPYRDEMTYGEFTMVYYVLK